MNNLKIHHIDKLKRWLFFLILKWLAPVLYLTFRLDTIMKHAVLWRPWSIVSFDPWCTKNYTSCIFKTEMLFRSLTHRVRACLFSLCSFRMVSNSLTSCSGCCNCAESSQRASCVIIDNNEMICRARGQTVEHLDEAGQINNLPESWRRLTSAAM